MSHKTILFCLLTFAVALARGATPFEGDWHGRLNLGASGSLPLILHIQPGPKATLDSPDQGAYNIPADETLIHGDSLCVRFNNLDIAIEGRHDGDHIAATLTQRGHALDIKLLPGGGELPQRPQTPVTPLPYPTHDFTFRSEALGGADFSGTLSAPENARTAVVMVSGSGLQDRDETILGHKPFAVIADRLARDGIASLRYDDRGFGASGGRESLPDATTETFAADARAAVNSLRATGRYDIIGVLGHSEGATIALMLADEPGLIDFAIGIGTPALRGDSILFEQNRFALLEGGISDSLATQYCRAFADVARFAVAYGPGTALMLKAATASSTLGNGPVEKQLGANLREAAKAIATPWMREFLALDSRPLIANATCPTLLIYGALDRQVAAPANPDAARGVSPMVDVVVLPSLNHMMQTSTTGSPREYGLISETIAPIALDEIARFAASQQKKNAKKR